MKLTFLCLVLLLALSGINAQSKQDSELFKTLKAKDALLFDRGFNNCDISQLKNLVSEDFEFYHDQAGITPSKEAFIKSIEEEICKLSYKPRRELVEGSLEVFPLKNNGVLYGAIQIGQHRFFAIEKDKPEYLTSVAKFTHLWKLEKAEWKLLRVLSYDHQPANKK
jgi:hypothetical protein